MSATKTTLLLGLLLPVILFASESQQLGNDNYSGKSQKASNPTLTVENNLKRRALARWQHLIDGEIDSVYQYASPNYRKLYTKEQFTEHFNSAVKWKSVEVLKMSVSDNSVKIVLNIAYKLPPQLDLERQSSLGTLNKEIEENWVKIDNEWWHVDL